MSLILCPNCRVVTPRWDRCANCDAEFKLPVARSGSFDANDADLQMDPKLRRLKARMGNQGIAKLDTASTAANEASVIALVEDLDAFKAIDGVRVIVSIPPLKNGNQRFDSYTIVTARMPVALIEQVRPQVFSLKESRRLKPCLESTLREVLPPKRKLNGTSSGTSPLRVKPRVIVGFVDFGMDFCHRNFLDAEGKSRVLAIWNQSKNDEQSRGRQKFTLEYGSLYLKEEIDRALEAEDPYKTLGYTLPDDSITQTGAHGTYVADIAVGNGKGTGQAGIAPDAAIVFVDVATSESALAINNSFGDSAQLLEAVKFIFDFADQYDQKPTPCVINLSLGTNGGPHDGLTPVEIAIDRLLREKPNRAVVVAAGNSFGQSLHATGQIGHGKAANLKMRLPKNDPTCNELEIWYSGEDRFAVDVIDPHGQKLMTVEHGKQWEFSRGLLSVINRRNDPLTGDNLINLFFERGLCPGEWTIRLRGTQVKHGAFHAWIERDENGQARFVESKTGDYQIEDSHTLGSISCGERTIVVGSFNAHIPETPLGLTSSAGPTRDGRRKPDLSAPGELVLAAHSRTRVLRNRASGTSIAAAAVTGGVALLLSEAVRLKTPLWAETIRDILNRTAQNNPPFVDGWHPRYGHGRLRIPKALEEVAVLAKLHPDEQSMVGMVTEY